MKKFFAYLFSEQNWKGRRGVFFGTGTAVALISFLAVVFFGIGKLVQALWSWTMPNLFPRLVADGYLAADIPLWSAISAVILLVLVGGLMKGGSTTKVVTKEKPAPAVYAARGDDADIPVIPVEPPGIRDILSDREREVLVLLSKGLTNTQIAAKLGVTESTVVFHCGRIFEKLGVGSRVEAAVWAKEHGII